MTILFNLLLLCMLFMHNPLSPISLMWEQYFAPCLREYLGVSNKQPVSAYVAPYIFLSMLSMMVSGFLPYSVMYLGDFRFVLWLSFTLWLMTFLYVLSSERFFSSLWKREMGFFMACFLFFVELLSTFIKPITLSVRLYANLMFGHYMMEVVFNFLHYIGGPFLLWMATPFVLFELAVFVVQSYIFTYLIISYFGELY